MTARLRVGVVGAGIVGCSAAFELARRGADVTVFDMRAPGGGATQASAGVLAPFIEGHDHGELMKLAITGLERYPDFVARVRAVEGIAAFEYRRQGTLEIAETPQRADALRARAGTLPASVQLEWIGAPHLQELEPATNPGHAGALFCPVHGFVAVTPFLSAIVTAAKSLGARFHSGVPVDGVSCEAASCLVRGEGRTYHFDRVLLSAGSWSSRLDPLEEIRGRVRPIKGQLVTLHWSGPRITRVLWGSSCYVVPWDDSTLLVGATSEDVGFDERPTAAGVAGLLTSVMDLLPGSPTSTFRDVRVGLRPATDDGLPILRPSAADPRVFYATGHFRNGVLLAPLTADLVADYFLSG